MLKYPARVNDYGLVGRSQRMAEVRRMIEKAARNRLPVLLLGQSGTGKEVVAKAIHTLTGRGKLVPIDCGALVGNLMESELFGHVRGAFSGADLPKKGLVEEADGGTAFFDEIGDLPLDMQVKLLRLIQEREFRSVGSVLWKKVDIRIIAATHRDLKAEVAAGRFRLDLYFRLNVLPLRLPPLADRKEDIPLLIEHFANGAMLPTSEMARIFQAYDWPGNVRELKHCVERMIAMRSEGALSMADMPSALLNFARGSALAALAQSVDQPDGELPEFTRHRSPETIMSVPDSEEQAIRTALKATGGEREKTAEILKISRTTLYRRMKQYKLV